jgi:outer membrane protein assembly factor BamB
MKTATALLLLSFTVVVRGADHPLVWPSFRGPGGSGVADDQRPPVEIGPDKNVKWKVAVPSGLSSPIVAGDKLVITAMDEGKLYTIAYNRADGKEAWRAEAPARELEPYHKTEGSPAASTPVTDGERIVSYFGSCGIFCYDLAGKELWKYELPKAHTGGDFGSGVSPIIADGVVILVRDTPTDSRILAVNAVSGSLLWETKRRSPTSYSTPVVWETPAGKQVAMAGHARIIGYDLQTGTEKWSLDGIPAACCSSPVAADGVLLFAGASPGTGEDEKPAHTPTYDDLLKDLDKDKDGALSRAEAEQAFQGFFDNQDGNKDGKVSRGEWDAIMKMMSQGQSSAFALQPGTGDATEPQLLWKKARGLPYVPSAIAYRGQYVMVKDGGVVTAYDTKTGDEVYQKRAAANGTYYASPVAANGYIYAVSLADGAVTVLKAGSASGEVVAKNPPLGERVAATPAIADNTLYIRTAGNLYAFAAGK